jgi:TetR/AcrR family transcriptional repressor of nem operon
LMTGRSGPMKVSREQAAENRARVVKVAARLYRERGFDGIGVADIMKAAGLTHGGFYGQFGSKEELMAEAGARALAESNAAWQRLLQAAPDDQLAAITGAYLSPRHRDNPGRGCALAALGADAARSAPAVKRALTEGFNTLLEVLAGVIPGRTKAAKRDKALVAYAGMVGALVLSRTVDDAALSEEILQAVLSSLPKPASATPAQ